MRIGGVNGPSFKGNIIDAHMHLGHWVKDPKNGNSVHFREDSIDAFVRSPLDVTVNGTKQQDNIEKVLLSNLDCLLSKELKDEYTGNKELLAICERNPKYYMLAACKPSDELGSFAKINKLMKEKPEKLVGLKFHPRSQNLAPDDFAYNAYFKLAERYKLPCLVHSDAQIDDKGLVVNRVSSPEAIYKAAQNVPDVPVIMAHMGAGDEKSHNNAIDILLKSIDNNDAKLYVDISWVDWGNDGLSGADKPSLVKLINELQKRNATDRILFGTDAPLGCFGEDLKGGLSAKQAYEKTVSDIKSLIKKNFTSQADELIDKIFYKNADELFFKRDWAKAKERVVHNFSPAKLVGVIVAGIAVFAGAGYLLDKIRPQKEDKFNK